jgi:nitrite reductase/ring-hydroxylating ferredoxin subunit/uncharacterized membrane protein
MSALHDYPSKIASTYAEPIDRIAKLLTKPERFLKPGFIKDTLSGTRLGHPLHPVLTDVAIGSWTSAAVIDVIGGERGAAMADALVGIGVLSAVPTAVSGWSDWLDTEGEARRIGVVHGVGNAVVIAMYTASWVARRRGRRGLGVALGMLAGGVATGTAYLGGHLVYGQGVGVDNTAFDTVPAKWTKVLDDADGLIPGTPVLVQVKNVPVMVVSGPDGVEALHDRCSHRGGPLHKGVVKDGTVTCPWHESCFRLADGAVLQGPATAPQPSYEARINEGAVEVRRRPVVAR